jgi:ferredoxin
MKIKVDDESCTGHGRCSVLAGAVYELDDLGYNVNRGSVIAVAPGNEDAARLGVKSCPEGAITLVEEGDA